MIKKLTYDEVRRLIPDGSILYLREDIADIINYVIDKINKELDERLKEVSD